MQRFSRPGGFQLGAELLDDAHVIRVLVAVDHNQRMRIRLAQQVFRFVNLVGGVHSDENGAYLGGCPKSDEPLGDIGGPDGDMVTGPYAQGDQRAGKCIDIIPELGICPGIIQGGIAEGILVGKLLHHPVKHLGKGQIYQFVLPPDIFSRACVVFEQVPLYHAYTAVTAHVVGKVRENHSRIVEVRRPALDPFQRYKAVVVY
ncbi:MAG: hypothetical protein BWY80_00732 [Firmicutes bacterium ADurb.Bin456]|nr:MAG: hypothetical protein BWY80_00732 [Firmicutes bacterium ADurb.Bin456]